MRHEYIRERARSANEGSGTGGRVLVVSLACFPDKEDINNRHLLYSGLFHDLGRIGPKLRSQRRILQSTQRVRLSRIDDNILPHQWAVDTATINEHRDMRQPGVHTVQVREDNVKSNTVTVTVTP